MTPLQLRSGLELTLGVFHSNSALTVTFKPLVYAACRQVLATLQAFSAFLQRNELLTLFEQEAHRTTQDLVAALFRLLAGYECHCPELTPDLRCFGAYFISAGTPNEDFEKDCQETELSYRDYADLNGEPFACCILFDVLKGESILLAYLADAFKSQTASPSLVQVVLSALSRAKALSERNHDILVDLLTSFKHWCRDIESRAIIAELVAGLASIKTLPHSSARAIQLELVVGCLTELDAYEIESEISSESPTIPRQTLDELMGSIPSLLNTGEDGQVKAASLQIKGYACKDYSESDQETEEACTYRQTGREYQLQHWYYCYTCDLTGSRGCCSICVRRCHSGHQVVYSRKANFFCDCGHSNSCRSMPKTRSRLWSNNPRRRIERYRDIVNSSFLPDLILVDLERGYNTHREPRADDVPEFEEGQTSPYFVEEEKEIVEEDKDFYIEDDKEESEEEESSSSSEVSSAPSQQLVVGSQPSQPLTLGLRDLKPVLTRLCQRRLPHDFQPPPKVDLWTTRKHIDTSRILTKPRCSFKPFANVFKSNQAEEQVLKDSCLNYPVLKQKIAAVASLDLILVAEASKLLALDATLLKSTGFDLDRNQLVVLARHSIHFIITSITVNPHNPKVVAVAGLNQCVVLQLHDGKLRGYAKTKLTLELQFEPTKIKNPIVKTAWLTPTRLVIATSRELKVYELLCSIYVPQHVFMSQETDITDLAVTQRSLLASSTKGFVYRQSLDSGLESGVLREIFKIPNKEHAIMALSYLPEPDLIVATFNDFQVLVGKLSAVETSVEQLLWLNFSYEFSSNSMPGFGYLCNFTCVNSSEGLVLLAAARKTNSTVVVLHITQETCYVHLQKKGGYTEGLASYDIDTEVYLVSCYEGHGVLVSTLNTDLQMAVPLLRLDVLNSWLSLESLPKSVHLPVTRFERCSLMNAQRLLGGMSVTRNELVIAGDPVTVFGSSKAAIEKLSVDRSSEGSGLSTNTLADPRVLSLSVQLEGSSSNNLVIAGLRVLVDAPAGAVLELLNRKIKLQGGKRWYDLALSDIEIVKAHLQGRLALRLVLPSTRVALKLNNLEVFGLPANAFGLDQKLCELSRAAQGHASLEEQALLYSQHDDWTMRKELLRQVDPDQRTLFLTATALSSFSEDGSDELVMIVAQHFLNSPSPLVRVAAKESVKRLLAAGGKAYAYQPIKALSMAWYVTYTSEVSASYIQKTVKALAKLQRQYSHLLYICSCLPALCPTIASSLKPKSYQLVAEDCMKVFLADLHRYDYFGSPCLTSILKFLQHPNPLVRAETLSQLYPLLKRRTKCWIGNTSKAGSPMTNVKGLSLAEIFSEVEPPNLGSCIEPILRNTETKVQLKDSDLCYAILDGLLLSPSVKIEVADSTLCLVEKLMKMLEKHRLAEEWHDVKYSALISRALVQSIQREAVESFQCALVRVVYKVLACHEAKPMKGGLIKDLSKDVLESIFTKLTTMLAHFKTGNASRRAVYQDGVFFEVVTGKDVVACISPHCGNSELLSLLDGDASFYSGDYDLFLVKTLLQLATELLKEGTSQVDSAQNHKVVESSSEEEGEIQMQDAFEPFELSEESVKLMCEYLNEPSLRSERRHVKDLLKLATALEGPYLSVFHKSIHNSQLAKVELLAHKTDRFTQVHSYHDQLAISSALKTICKRAVEHPQHWQEAFCSSDCQINEHPAVLTLFQGALNLEGDPSTACVGLLALAFGVKPKHGLGFGLKLAREAVMGQANRPWGGYFEEFQMHIVEALLLESHSKNCRSAAGAFVLGMWRHASAVQRESMLALFLGKLSSLHRYGSNSDVFLRTLNKFLENDAVNSEVRQLFIERLFGAFKALSQQLAVHPNCEVYETLQYILSNDPRTGFSGYFLESEPCLRCFEAQNTVSEVFKLQDVQSEARFANTSHFVQLKDPLVIDDITVDISDLRGNRAVDKVTFSISNREFHDIAAVKKDRSHWNKVCQVDVAHYKPSTVKIKCKEPALARFIMLEYRTASVLRSNTDEHQQRTLFSRDRNFPSAGKHELRPGDIIGLAAGPERELLPCPRCSKIVEDRHGVCSCGENAFQCGQCRNINYENLGAFFCNECGTSRFCKLEVQLTARVGPAKDRVIDEASKLLAEDKVEHLIEGIQEHFDVLPKRKETLHHLVHSAKGLADYDFKFDLSQNKSLNPVINRLTGLYSKEARQDYSEMMKAVRTVVGLRKELILYNQGVFAPVASEISAGPVVCYGCLHGFLLNLLNFFKCIKDPRLKHCIITQYEIVPVLFAHTLHSPCNQVRKVTREALCSLVKESCSGSSSLYKLMEGHVSMLLQLPSVPLDVLREDLQVFFSLCNFHVSSAVIDDAEKAELWNMSLQHFWKVFLAVLSKAWTHSGLANLLDKFLELVLEMVYKVVVFQEGDLWVEDAEDQELIAFNSVLRCNVLHRSVTHQKFLDSCLNSSIADLYPQWQAGNVVFSRWQLTADTPALVLPSNWLVDCLLFMQYPRIQDLARMILKNLAESGLSNAVLDVTVAALPKALKVCQQGSDYYFTVLSFLLLEKKCSRDVRLLQVFLDAVETASNTLLFSQDRYAQLGLVEVSISQGHGLSCLLQLVISLSEQPWAKQELRRSLSQVIRSLLNVRRLLLIKNKVIAESQETLERLFDVLHTDCSPQERTEFMSQCIEASRFSEATASVFLYEQICKLIAPTQPDPVYRLHLSKSASQEEYIRGSMEKNPYSSKEVGPLMKHVRLHVCRELELSDPDLLELLVADRIISPELRVIDVYEHVLWPYLQETNINLQGRAIRDVTIGELPNMVVVYRLIGLDGEATEDRVDSLPALIEEELDLEQKYSVAEVLGQSIDGLSALEQGLCALEDDPSLALQQVISTLLYYGCMLHTNRNLFVKANGLPRLLKLLERNLTILTTTRLLRILEQILSDSSLGQQHLSHEHVRVLLLKLNCHLENSPEVVALLTQILPEVLDANQSAFDEVYATFEPCVLWNKSQTARPKLYHEVWVRMLSSLNVKHGFMRDQLIQVQHTQKLIDYLGAVHLADNSSLDCISAAIRTLTGLCQGHAPTQRLLPAELLKAVLQFSQTHVTPSQVGDLCEILVETLVSRPDGAIDVKDYLVTLIDLDRQVRRKKAASKREEVLGEMVSSLDVAAMFGIEEGLDDEKGLSCVICKEGYGLRPHEVLGFYVYAKPTPVNLADEHPTNQADIVNAVSNVTHFTVIHASCHENAAKAERSRGKPKSEWEGATIRNQHTKCNNWVPIRGPHTSDTVYFREVARMFSRAEPEICHLQNAIHDLRLMLTRFGFEMNFSKDSKGGGPEHNLQAIPYMLQLALHLLKTEDPEYAIKLGDIFHDFTEASLLTCDQILHWTVLILMLKPAESWQGYKRELLKRAVASARLKPGCLKTVFVGLEAPGDCDERSLEVANNLRPLLIVFKIVDSFYTQCFFPASIIDWPMSLLEHITQSSPTLHEQVSRIYEELRAFTTLRTLRQALEGINCRSDLDRDLAGWLL